jgi:nicotinate-nucleotide adenylyltransferase
MKLAILGGSFNPIHLGHLYLADTVLSTLGIDRLILTPANISPFKVHRTGAVAESVSPEASGQDRLDMVLASVTADPRIAVDDLELRRGGVSYTIDTLDEIIDRYRPRGKPLLVLGDDAAENFPLWSRAGEIVRKAEIVIARRRSLPASGAPAFPFPHTSLQNEIMEISSAMVRERISRGKAWRYLVPRGTRLIIEDRGLYGLVSPAAAPGLPSGGLLSLTARVEDAVRGALSPGRFIHSRNTALLARDLARHYGLDGEAAYLAGIAHDMAKDLGRGEILALAEREGPVTAGERKKPGLLHGRAAAVLLRERLGIHNRDVLEAVSFHTTGRAGMGPLAQTVFIADKIEVSRQDIHPRFRDLAGSAGPADSLERLFQTVLEDNVRWLKQQDLEPAEETLGLLSALHGNLAERS